MAEPDWVELAKLQQASFHNRRALEWKLALGFWGAIAAFTAAILTKPELAITTAHLPTLKWVYIGLLIVSVVCWKYPLQYAHAGDKSWYSHYMSHARGKPEDRSKEYCCIGNMRSRNVFWLLGQVAFTAAFLYLSWVLISAHAKPKSDSAKSQTKAVSIHSDYAERECVFNRRLADASPNLQC